MNAIVPLIILIGGVLLLGAGAYSFFRQRDRIARSLRAEGVVTELIRVRARETSIASKADEGVNIEARYRYRPQVQFRTKSGRAINFVARISSSPPRHKVGEQVTVFYDPQKPSEAQLDNFWDLWFPTLMLAFWGVFAVGMGLLGLVMPLL